MLARFRTLSLLLALASSAAAWASGDEGAWWSYRDAYRALVKFDKLSQPKHLIQQQLQVQALTANPSVDGLQLRLQGGATDISLALDTALHTRVPLLKTAYDDNAVLRLNRRAQAFGFRVRISILPRPDGSYPVQELRQACEQVLEAQRRVDSEHPPGKRCIGVNLVYGRDTSPLVNWRLGSAQKTLSAVPGPLYPGEADREHAVVPVRWEAGGENALVHTQATPILITAVLE